MPQENKLALIKKLVWLPRINIWTQLLYKFAASTAIQQNVVSMKYWIKDATTLQPKLDEVCCAPARKTMRRAMSDTHKNINNFGARFFLKFLNIKTDHKLLTAIPQYNLSSLI